MTVRTPPTFLQAGSHTAENTRLLAHGLLQSTPSSFAGGVAAADPAHGVARIGDLTVSQNGTPNMSVNVASGGCFIRGTQSAAQGVYHVFNDATVNLSIDTADATNPRRDLIVMQVRDSGYAGANDDARLLVVKGTAAASPVDPTPPADCLVLARVAVAANATSIVTANITDLRTYAYGNSLMPRFASTAERNTYLPTPVEGMMAYTSDTDTYWAHDGSSWLHLVSPAALQTWTPTITASTTNPTLGTGATQSGYYTQIGKMVFATAQVTFGTSGVNAGSGTYSFSLPITPLTTSGSRNYVTGSFFAQDVSAPATAIGITIVGATSVARCIYQPNNNGTGSYNDLTSTVPWAWAAGDQVRWTCTYPIA